MRQISLDTETTGISHEKGHRIIEIGCIELIDRKITGNHYHTYINPQREVDAGAFRVHGISTEFLQDKPAFKSIIPAFLDFIADSELLIHNAPFDVGFLNAEMRKAKKNVELHEYCPILDNLELARKKHPGQRNSLDALCKRYFIDNTNRKLHGALIDAELLARVYLAMTGGQINLFGEEDDGGAAASLQSLDEGKIGNGRVFPVLTASAEELELHNQFLDKILEKTD
jgi:DNA polymerase-3 subunit epsilon